MRKKVVLITGAVGEIGQALIEDLSRSGEYELLTMDLRPLPDAIPDNVTHIVGDILDRTLFARLVTEYEFDTIFHFNNITNSLNFKVLGFFIFHIKHKYIFIVDREMYDFHSTVSNVFT